MHRRQVMVLEQTNHVLGEYGFHVIGVVLFHSRIGQRRQTIKERRTVVCDSPEGRTATISSFVCLTMDRDLALIKHMFSFAQRQGRLERNPVRFIKLEKENNARDRMLTAEEFEGLQACSALHLQAILWPIRQACGAGKS